MPSIEEQKKQRITKCTTIIVCSIMISILLGLIKTRYLETLDDSQSLWATLVSIIAFCLMLFSGYAAGRGVAAILRAPYEK